MLKIIVNKKILKPHVPNSGFESCVTKQQQRHEVSRGYSKM